MIGRSNENGKENGHQTIFKEKRYSPQAEMILKQPRDFGGLSLEVKMVLQEPFARH